MSKLIDPFNPLAILRGSGAIFAWLARRAGLVGLILIAVTAVWWVVSETAASAHSNDTQADLSGCGVTGSSTVDPGDGVRLYAGFRNISADTFGADLFVRFEFYQGGEALGHRDINPNGNLGIGESQIINHTEIAASVWNEGTIASPQLLPRGTVEVVCFLYWKRTGQPNLLMDHTRASNHNDGHYYSRQSHVVVTVRDKTQASIRLGSTYVDFGTVTQGNSSTRYVDVNNDGGVTLKWSVYSSSDESNWLEFSKDSGGSGPGSGRVKIRVKSGAPIGGHRAYLRVKRENRQLGFEQNLDKLVTVDATVVAAPPTCELEMVATETIEFEGPPGGSFEVGSVNALGWDNTGSVSCAFDVSDNRDWIYIKSLSRESPLGPGQRSIAEPDIVYDETEDLSPGTYTGSVTVRNVTENETVGWITVRLTITEPETSPGTLNVSPSSRLSASGVQGGPFSPSSKTYTVSKTSSGDNINWTASSNRSWVSLSDDGGGLPGSDTDPVTVSINSNANSLSPGTHTATITFTNTTNGNGNTTREVRLTVNAPAPGAGSLVVSPSSRLSASGVQGGPFSPSSKTYTLSKTPSGSADVRWTATTNRNWISLSDGNDTLQGSQTDSVTVSINELANNLSLGTHTATITFTNTTNGNGNTTREVRLEVREAGSTPPPDRTDGLHAWTSESYRNGSSDGAPVWSMSDDGLAVSQDVNSYPAVFVSDFPVAGKTFRTTVSVGPNNDDDQVGFVIGYEVGDSTNDGADYLLVDWKKQDQNHDFSSPSSSPGGTSRRGLAASRVRGVPDWDEFWQHRNLGGTAPGSGLEELQRAANLGRTGWQINREYEFSFDLRPDSLRVYVNGSLELDIPTSRDYSASGRFGFYTFSQDSVTFSRVTVRDSEPRTVAPPVEEQPPATDDHGNSRSSATAMTVGASTLGYIETLGDRDYFSFPAERDAEYAIFIDLNTLADSELWLFDPSGNQIGHSDDDGEDKASHISFTPTEAGTYYLRVTAFNDDLTGSYAVKVLRQVPDDLPPTLEVSPPDGLTSEGPAGGLVWPNSMTFSLRNGGTAGQILRWRASSDRDWVTLSDNRGGLSDGESTSVTISINERAAELGVGTHHALIDFTNTTTGHGDTTRVVELTLSPPSDGSGGDGRIIFEDATQIEPGSWIPADIGESREQDHFSFTLKEGFLYKIRTELRGLQDTEMWLYNSAGVQIDHNDDFGGARSGIDFTASSSSTYYARVAARFVSDTGTYGIRLWEQEPPPPPGELRLSSSEGFSATGRMGGPFKSSSKTYELWKRPSGTEDIRWTVSSDEDWVSISIASGVLIDLDTDYVILSINEGAKSLEAGVHTAAVSFTNTTNGFGNATVKIELTVRGAAGGRPGVLVIIPDANLATSGPEGGPFSTTSKVYSITSSTVDGDSFVWSASSDQDWLSMSPSGGEIPGQVPHVTVTLNARALLLPAGLHTALASFTNQTTGLGDTTRIVELTVDASGTGGFTAVSAGRNHTCAIDAETYPVCWGDDEWGQASPPDGERLTSISAADNHTCGLREDGTPVCWGSNTYGQSGPPTGESFTQISSRYNHTCGLRTDGTVTCWGLNEQGQASPPPGEVFRSIASGVYQTCGHRLAGTVACWGDDSYGQSGLPRTERFEAVGTGWKVSCGLRLEGTVACVGSDPEADFTHPAEARVSTLSVGWLHACGLQLDGTPVCWGLDWHGRTSPPVGEKFVQISAGDEHTCGLRSDGVVLCWGDNTFGESSPPNSVETEPGDDHSDSTDAATAISVNRPYTGDIEESNDIDFFAFHGESEVRYTIETELGSNPDTVIDLYDSTGSRISGNDDGGVGRASKLESSFHVSGTYFVSVRGYSSSSRGTYQITVSGDTREVVDPPSADRVLFSGPASKIAHEGFETTDTLVSVTLSPPDGEGLRELSISIEDADGISGAGSVTVVVPRESWIDYEGVTKWTRDTSGAEWRLYPPGFERSAVGADETFNALARQIPLLGNLMSFTDFLSFIWFNSVETVESPNDPVFHANYQNCYSQITVPWFVSNVSTVSAIDTVLGVRISIPVVVSDDDYAAFVSSFPGREPAPQGGVTVENGYVEMGDLLSTNRPAAACNAR